MANYGTNIPTAKPTVRTVSMKALSFEVAGPLQPYPIYVFSRGRTFWRRPYENPFAGLIVNQQSSGGGPGL